LRQEEKRALKIKEYEEKEAARGNSHNLFIHNFFFGKQYNIFFLISQKIIFSDYSDFVRKKN